MSEKPGHETDGMLRFEVEPLIESAGFNLASDGPRGQNPTERHPSRARELSALRRGKLTSGIAKGAFDDSMVQLAFEPLTPNEREHKENAELGILTFRDSETGFELTMTDDCYDLIRKKYGGVGRMKDIFADLRKAVLQDPFGEHNIDEFADTDAGRWARVIQKLPNESPLADLVPGKRLAVKTTGMDMQSTRERLEFRAGRRSELVDQFRSTRRLIEAMKQVAPDGFLDGLVGVAEVYAVLREPKKEGDYEPREWMLMEYIPDAKSIEERRLVLSRGGTISGFDTAKYPELAEALKRKNPLARDRGRFSFEELVEGGFIDKYQHPPLPYMVVATVESCLSDLTGHNILEKRDPQTGQPHYTIIDVQEKPTRW